MSTLIYRARRRNCLATEMTRYTAALAMLACLLSIITASVAQDVSPDQTTISGEAKVIDGNSVSIQGKVFRLDGIDAPEVDQSCLDENSQLYPCGRVTAQELSKLIGQQHVQCEDRGPDTRYKKRRIGGCYAFDGNDINRWLVQQGWAVNFEPYAKGRFKGDEDEARAELRGLWKGCFVAPRDFRRWNKIRRPLRS